MSYKPHKKGQQIYLFFLSVTWQTPNFIILSIFYELLSSYPNFISLLLLFIMAKYQFLPSNILYLAKSKFSNIWHYFEPLALCTCLPCRLQVESSNPCKMSAC
jgi:hypothetical protein